MKMIYGCMNIGAQRVQDPFSALDAAWDVGYRFWDHADIYAAGRSESVFGEWFSKRGIDREAVTIQSKCGIVPSRDGSTAHYDFSKGHILSSVDGILSRLGVEYLDTLLLHRPDPLVEPDDVAAAFDQLSRSGKVRNFGVSNHSAMQIAFLTNTLEQPIVVNQMEVSLAHPDLIVSGISINQREPGIHFRSEDTLEYCRMHGISVQAWSPMAGGLFSDVSHPAGSLVAELATKHGVDSGAIVLAWLLRHPAGIVPVIGSTRPERIAASADAEGLRLTRQEWYALLEAARGLSVP